jgi:hypothetical protein
MTTFCPMITTYLENVFEVLTLSLDPVSKLCLDGYDLSLILLSDNGTQFISEF